MKHSEIQTLNKILVGNLKTENQNFIIMKLFTNQIKIIAALAFIFSVVSCEKAPFNKVYEGYDGKVYIAAAAEGRSNFSLPLSTKPWVLGFGAVYGGVSHTAPKDILLEFSLQENLISQYNQINGTSYIPLPTDSYTITGFNSVIKSGTTTSEPLSITIDRKKLDLKKKYMFPISLMSASSEKIDSAMRTAWFRIDTIIRSERDVTSQGSLSVSHDNNGGPDAGEGSKKLVDGNTSTKFLIQNINQKIPFNFQLTFPNPIVLGAYTFTSGNDAPDRDPKNWTLQASIDGINWTTLDARSNEMFSSRGQTIRYDFDNSMAYKYYKIVVSAINGGTLFQQSEWRVIEFYEE